MFHLGVISGHEGMAIATDTDSPLGRGWKIPDRGSEDEEEGEEEGEEGGARRREELGWRRRRKEEYRRS